MKIKISGRAFGAVPNKIKNFLWRACHDAIPTKKKKNLKRRQITITRCANSAVMMRKLLYMRCGLAKNSAQYGLHRNGVLGKIQVSQTLRSYCHGYSTIKATQSYLR